MAEGAQESSNVTLDTVEKVSKKQRSGPLLPIFKADSTKVTVKGMGLKKAFLGKQNQFQVNATEAGRCYFLILDRPLKIKSEMVFLFIPNAFALEINTVLIGDSICM